jgi:hypothetical protein
VTHAQKSSDRDHPAVIETAIARRAMEATPSLDGDIPMAAVQVPPARERRRSGEHPAQHACRAEGGALAAMFFLPLAKHGKGR